MRQQPLLWCVNNNHKTLSPPYNTLTGNWALAFHALPIVKNAACVTACVSAVIRSCSSALKWAMLELKQDNIFKTRSSFSSVARCLITIKGWPLGSTPGPCMEWHEIMCTSSGKYFSNASTSGFLTEVYFVVSIMCYILPAFNLSGIPGRPQWHPSL